MLAWSELVDELRDACKRTHYQDLEPFLNDVRDMVVSYKVSDDVSRDIFASLDILLSEESTILPEDMNTELSKLINQIQLIIDQKIDTRKSGQRWLMEKINAVGGYDVRKIGLCDGISRMATQAFLADDLKNFNACLQTIYEIPLDDFKNDFANLKQKEHQFLKEGQQDNADEVRNTIVDLMAFFDGVILHSNSGKHREFLPEHSEIPMMTNAQKAMQMTISKRLETMIEKGAKLVTTDLATDAIDKQAFQDYLKTIQQNLGDHSFVLNISHRAHELLLAYRAETRRWLLLDPNSLPGEEYIHDDNLINGLFACWDICPSSSASMMLVSVSVNCPSDEAAAQCQKGLDVLRHNMLDLWPKTRGVNNFSSGFVTKSMIYAAIIDELPELCETMDDITSIMYANTISSDKKASFLERVHYKILGFIITIRDVERIMECLCPPRTTDFSYMTGIFNEIYSRLPALINKPYEVNSIMKHLLPEQKHVLFDEIRPKLVKLCDAIENTHKVMEFLLPEQRLILRNDIGKQWIPVERNPDKYPNRYHRELASFLDEAELMMKQRQYKADLMEMKDSSVQSESILNKK